MVKSGAADADTDHAGCCPILQDKLLWTSPIQRSTQPIIPTNDGYEFERLLKVIEADLEEATDDTAVRGDPTSNFRLAARAVHLQTRAFYSKMMDNVGGNIFPFMLLSDADEGVPGGVGGMITIYHRDLSIERYVPSPPSYELLKNLSHMTLGVFTVVSPWFRCPGGLESPDALTFLSKVELAHKALNLPGVKFDEADKFISERAEAMYTIVEKYIKQWVAVSTCSPADFSVFAEEMDKYVPDNIKAAASIQANALYPKLKEIKERMGDQWEKLYVVVPTVWPVSGINPRVEILSRLMSANQMNTRVFVLDNMSSMAQYRQTLGRIIGDRCSANLIFGRSSHEREKMLYALSTRQDLMANACDEAMKAIIKKEKDDARELLGGQEAEAVAELLKKQLEYEHKNVVLKN